MYNIASMSKSNGVFSILQGLSEGDLEEIEEGTTDHAQNVMSAPIDNSNDENDIDEETM